MENQKETQKNPQYKYASTREKLCFGIGAIGKDAICNLVGAFLMLYFTDTLYLAPASVAEIVKPLFVVLAVSLGLSWILALCQTTTFGNLFVRSCSGGAMKDPYDTKLLS